MVTHWMQKAFLNLTASHTKVMGKESIDKSKTYILWLNRVFSTDTEYATYC